MRETLTARRRTRIQGPNRPSGAIERASAVAYRQRCRGTRNVSRRIDAAGRICKSLRGSRSGRIAGRRDEFSAVGRLHRSPRANCAILEGVR